MSFASEYGISEKVIDCEHGERHHWVGFDKVPFVCEYQTLLNWTSSVAVGFGCICLWKTGKYFFRYCNALIAHNKKQE